MIFHELPIEYYVKRLRTSNHFAFVGYSDAEWYSIIGHDLDRLTGFGQVIHADTGRRLLGVIQRRHTDPDFLFASPKCLWEWEDCLNAGIPSKIEQCFIDNGLPLDFELYERDMVLDDLANAAGLFPFIQQLRAMRTVFIGNHALCDMMDILGCDAFIGVSSPNLHLEPHGIEMAVIRTLDLDRHNNTVYLVSAGVSAALIIDSLYSLLPKCFFIDCGSIWDAFVGIGGQRGWRERLYADPVALQAWKDKNLYGTP